MKLQWPKFLFYFSKSSKEKKQNLFVEYKENKTFNFLPYSDNYL